MNKAEAYKIVLDDIMNDGPSMFMGTFDAKNGDKAFMFGIETVMEMIAYNASEQDYFDFDKIFTKNFMESLDKAKQV